MAMRRRRKWGCLHTILTSTGGGQLHAPAALPQGQNLVVHWIDYMNVIMDYLQANGYPLDKTRPNKHRKYTP